MGRSIGDNESRKGQMGSSVAQEISNAWICMYGRMERKLFSNEGPSIRANTFLRQTDREPTAPGLDDESAEVVSTW